jgi:hypothetical protein
MVTSDSKAEAFVDKMKAMAGGHGDGGGDSKGSSSSPASPPGGSSSSGGGSSGGGHSGGGSSGSADKGKEKIPMPIRYIMAFAGLITAFSALWWTTHDTPPNRAKSEQIFMEGQTEAEKTAQEKEKTKQLREQRRIAETEARAKLAQASTEAPPAVASVPQITSAVCQAPAPGETLFWKPLQLSPASCVTLAPPQNGGMYFWAVFRAVPTNMSGIAEIAAVHDVGNRTPDGNPIPERTGEGCAGNCSAFLSRHLGEVVFVRQLLGQNLQINF